MMFAPHPASNSSLLVQGDAQVTCWTRGRAWLL
jgi:hypothetical protein